MIAAGALQRDLVWDQEKRASVGREGPEWTGVSDPAEACWPESLRVREGVNVQEAMLETPHEMRADMAAMKSGLAPSRTAAKELVKAGLLLRQKGDAAVVVKKVSELVLPGDLRLADPGT